jgi:hypothetical protein
MELMPPLLYFLQQAYKDLPPSSYATHDWEWSTLIVFSFAQVCLSCLSTALHDLPYRVIIELLLV